MIGNNQCEFMKQKSGLIMPLCSTITGMVNERTAGDDVHLDFSKAFSTVSHIILTDKLIKYGLEKWTARWIEDFLNCWCKEL